jgi:hypothetical protein
MKNSVFWDINPCSPLKVNRHFEGLCRLHLFFATCIHAGLLLGLFFGREDRGDMVSETSVDFKCATLIYTPDDINPNGGEEECI